MKFTLAVTHYNRSALLKQCFPDLVGKVNEILIYDDCSTKEEIREVVNNHYFHAKIRGNVQNMGMSRAKADAVNHSQNNWVILFDSDNIIKEDYLKAIPKRLDPNVIYCPSFARPDFDYRPFEGVLLNRETIKPFLNKPMFDCHLNTANYLVNRKVYMKNYRFNPDVKGNDTLWHAYNHLANGGSFFIVPGMEYFHRVHAGSEYMKHVNYNLKQATEIKKLILEL